MHQEAVHLGLGKRIGAFLLDRVLSGHDHEEVREFVCLPCHRDLPFLHGLEQGSLHLGGRPVDLVRQDQVVEDRSRLKAKLPFPVHTVIDLGPRDVGRQEVRGELDAREARFKHLGNALDGTGLGQAGQSFDQNIAVGQEGNDQPFDHVFLSDDRALHLLVKNLIASRAELFPFVMDLHPHLTTPAESARHSGEDGTPFTTRPDAVIQG